MYTAEGKLCAEILHGEETWVREYEYKNGQISEIKQFMVDTVIELVEITQRRYTKSGLLNAAQSEYGGWYEYGYTDGVISSAKEQGGIAAILRYNCFSSML